ncbi:hypothetical protein [Nonomuraea sp. NPDC049607]|uniref:hypothetical protein n=1 Tax=Nonomuraea sp. NPDC049607 TaxID=3154732 RepID=UPI0034170C20
MAGTIAVTDEMAAKFTRSDELMRDLVARAHAAGVLRPDATAMDISLLIEQLGKSPLIEQLDRQDRVDLIDAARNARKRAIAIALDGLRPGHPQLPGTTPPPALLVERWEHARPSDQPGTRPA